MDKLREKNHQWSFTGTIGVESSVQFWAWKLFTAGSIISGLSITSNDQVSEYTYFCFCMCNELHYFHGGFMNIIVIVI